MTAPALRRSTDATGTVVETSASGVAPVELATAVRAAAAGLPVDGFSLWVDGPDGAVDDALAAAGFARQRDLYRMEVDLPLAWSSDVETRAFEVGRDEAAWVEVNNRAFAWHREQSGWTVERVRELEREAWFDPDGFRVHERDGRMVGFCWTKIHRDEAPAVGEIFVIAVDPDVTGTGLGRAMTLAGLDWLHRVAGLRRGMLFVDADNEPAVGLYRKLGFAVAITRRLYLPATGAP